MKFFAFFLCLLSAALLSLLAALYASGWIRNPAADNASAKSPSEGEMRITLFPEQHRAVDELLKANLARQDALVRQESLLAERAESIRQEAAALARMREDLSAAKAEIEAYFKRIDDLIVGWDAAEQKNTRKLAEFYSKKEPQNAARLLSKVEPDRAARVLSLLSDRQAGAIMDASVGLGADGIDLAVKWSDIIRQLKKPQAPPETQPN